MNFTDQLTSLPTRYLQGNIITIKIFILILELFKYFLKEVYIHFHYLPIYPFRITVTTLGNISRFFQEIRAVTVLLCIYHKRQPNPIKAPPASLYSSVWSKLELDMV